MDITSDPATNEILQEHHYYPFGMAMEGDWVDNPVKGNRYWYNGKEWNEGFGLEWYDYGARWYDPAIGRWSAVDPLAEIYKEWSPYNYVLDNLIRFIDPDGNSVSPPIDYYDNNGNYIGHDGNPDDDRNFVVTDRKEAGRVKKTNRKKGTTSLDDLNSAEELPSVTAMEESLNLLDRTQANGGLREESSIVMKDGTVVRGETGELPKIVDGVQIAETPVPSLPDGSTDDNVKAIIHSHPTTTQVVERILKLQVSRRTHRMSWLLEDFERILLLAGLVNYQPTIVVIIDL